MVTIFSTTLPEPSPLCGCGHFLNTVTPLTVPLSRGSVQSLSLIAGWPVTCFSKRGGVCCVTSKASSQEGTPPGSPFPGLSNFQLPQKEAFYPRKHTEDLQLSRLQLNEASFRMNPVTTNFHSQEAQSQPRTLRS